MFPSGHMLPSPCPLMHVLCSSHLCYGCCHAAAFSPLCHVPPPSLGHPRCPILSPLHPLVPTLPIPLPMPLSMEPPPSLSPVTPRTVSPTDE